MKYVTENIDLIKSDSADRRLTKVNLSTDKFVILNRPSNDEISKVLEAVLKAMKEALLEEVIKNPETILVNKTVKGAFVKYKMNLTEGKGLEVAKNVFDIEKNVYKNIYKNIKNKKKIKEFALGLSKLSYKELFSLINKSPYNISLVNEWIDQLEKNVIDFGTVIGCLSECFVLTLPLEGVKTNTSKNPLPTKVVCYILESFRYKSWILWPSVRGIQSYKQLLSLPVKSKRKRNSPYGCDEGNHYLDFVKSLNLNIEQTTHSGCIYGLVFLFLSTDIQDGADMSPELINVHGNIIGSYASLFVTVINKYRTLSRHLFENWRPKYLVWDKKKKKINEKKYELNLEYNEGDYLTLEFEEIISHSKDRDFIKASKYEQKYTLINDISCKELSDFLTQYIEETAKTFVNYLEDIEARSLFRYGPSGFDMAQNFNLNNCIDMFYKKYPEYKGMLLKEIAEGVDVVKLKVIYLDFLYWLPANIVVENIARCRFSSSILNLWQERALNGEVKGVLEDIAAYSLLTFNNDYNVLAKHLTEITFYQVLKLAEALRYKNVWLFPKYKWEKEHKRYFYLPIDERLESQELSNNFVVDKVGLPAFLSSLTNEDKTVITTSSGYTKKRMLFLLNTYLSAELLDYSDLSTELFDFLGFDVDRSLAGVEGFIDVLSKKHYKLYKNDNPVPVYVSKTTKDNAYLHDLSRTKDSKFSWVIKEHQELRQWVDSVAWFIEEDMHGLKSNYNAIEYFNIAFDWLLKIKECDNEGYKKSLNPLDINRFKHIRVNTLKELNPVEPSLRTYLRDNTNVHTRNKVLSMLEKFFREVNDGKNIPINTLSDKFYTEKESSYLSVSNKPVLPTRIWNLMKKILTDKDYEWAKSINTDWTSGYAGEGEWVPTRAIFMQTLLTTPVRFDNVQTADMGYMDKLWFDEKLNKFVPNTRYKKDKSIKKIRQLGAIKYFHDHRGSTTGFYFTNNKTSTKGNGLDIVWDNVELRDAFIRQRNYIIKNKAVMPYDIAKDRGWSLSVRERMGHACTLYPLFVDLGHPTNKFKTKVVGVNRMRDFFLRLLGEAENKYNKSPEGIANPLALPLITDWRTKKNNRGRAKLNKEELIPNDSEFTLHSCRVTGITHFACSGLPPHIIAQCLSGHSSILMNLYYTKLGPSLISNMIMKAHNERQENEELIPLSILSSEIPVLEQIFSHGGDSENITLLSKTDPTLWWTAKGYICPNRGTKCNEGGFEKESQNLGKADCSRCKFAITGPMFLNQLVVSGNQLIYQLDTMFDKYNELSDMADKASDNQNYFDAQKFTSQANAVEEDMKALVQSMIGYIESIKKSKSKLPTWDALQERLNKSDDINNIVKDFNDKNYIDKLSKDGDGADFEIIDGVDRDILTVMMAFIGEMSPSNKECLADERLFKMILRYLDKHGSASLLLSLDEEESRKASLMFAQTIATYFYGISEAKKVTSNETDIKALQFTNAVLNGNISSSNTPELNRIIKRMSKVITEGGLEKLEKINPSQLALDAAQKQLSLIVNDTEDELEVINE